jgi:hypothetical protein
MADDLTSLRTGLDSLRRQIEDMKWLLETKARDRDLKEIAASIDQFPNELQLLRDRVAVLEDENLAKRLRRLEQKGCEEGSDRAAERNAVTVGRLIASAPTG